MLAEQGEFAEAASLGMSVLIARRHMLGDYHVDTLDAMSSVAFILQSGGHLEDSLEFYAEALQRRLETLGEDSPKTLDSMHDVAQALVDLAARDEMHEHSDPGRRLGFLESARELNARVLERRSQLLGDEAPKTLTSAANLANTMRALGDFSAAHELNLKTLETQRRVLGSEHPSTLTTLNNIAVGLYHAGEQQGAGETMAYVLDARSRVLGADHPLTLDTMSSLAAVLTSTGDLTRAIDLGERAVTGLKRVLGPGHPLTRRAFMNLFGALGKASDPPTTRAVIARVAPNLMARPSSSRPDDDLVSHEQRAR